MLVSGGIISRSNTIGKRPIRIWDKMKKELIRRFLSNNYKQDFYRQLHNLHPNNLTVETSSQRIYSEKNYDAVAEEVDAHAEETQAADSHDAKQIPDVVESLEGSGNIKGNVLNPLCVGRNGTLLNDKEEEFSANRIVRVYETEEAEQDENFIFDGPSRMAMTESSEAAKQIIDETKQDSSNLNDNSNFVHVDGFVDSPKSTEVDVEEMIARGRNFFQLMRKDLH